MMMLDFDDFGVGSRCLVMLSIIIFDFMKMNRIIFLHARQKMQNKKNESFLTTRI